MNFTLPGWDIRIEGTSVLIRKDPSPEDSYRPGETITLSDWTPYDPDDLDDTVRRVFATIQYLTDHELRENFKVDGVRPFDAHPGYPEGLQQKEWWVDRQSAVNGY